MWYVTTMQQKHLVPGVKKSIFKGTYMRDTRTYQTQMVPGYPVDTLPSRTSGTTRLVPLYHPVIPVTPGAIRVHITSTLDRLNTVLDAGRGGWCR